MDERDYKAMNATEQNLVILELIKLGILETTKKQKKMKYTKEQAQEVLKDWFAYKETFKTDKGLMKHITK